MVRSVNIMDNTNNKAYWENYVSYWKDKVCMANENGKANDKTIDDAILMNYIKKLNLDSRDVFLDFGCGFCRSYPCYREIVGETDCYYGVDITEAPLRLAEELYPVLKNNERLKTYDGILIPYDDESFDKIICFGVFDACNQEVILKGLLRILKVNGELLLTGKNNLYNKDDEGAYIAEINARKKGHPNYFTDVKKMSILLEESGIAIKESFFFEKRGDFPNNRYCTNMPDIFYEWAFILKKSKSDMKICTMKNLNFSSEYSKTYKLRKGE